MDTKIYINEKLCGIIVLHLLQARFNGSSPECVMHSVSVTQKKVNKDHGGAQVLSDRDINYMGQTLIGAGKYIASMNRFDQNWFGDMYTIEWSSPNYWQFS